MAEAIFNDLAKSSVSESAGAKPEYYIRHHGATMPNGDPVVVVMKELGLNLQKNKIKKVTRKMVEGCDIVVALMTKERARDDLPNYVKDSKKFRLWNIKDVSGLTPENEAVERHRKNRDIIKERVEDLLSEIE
jgi:protein-tyrosine-phosphatase